MSAGPLVVTHPLTGRSRAIVTEELGEPPRHSISSIWRRPKHRQPVECSEMRYTQVAIAATGELGKG